MNIRRNDKVRNKVCGLPIYWTKPGVALSALQTILADAGLEVDGPASFPVHDRTDDYTAIFPIAKDGNRMETRLVFSWHWMASKCQVEIVAYLT